MEIGAVCQIALCTDDLPRTARILTQVLGFAHAGGRVLWGALLAQIQDLPTQDDSTAVIWWQVGRQDFVQLELFTHTTPAQRPRSGGWRPADLGWTRWGVAVSDFDAALRTLASLGIQTITEPMGAAGSRRVCFREPGADVIVEIMEDSADFPGGQASRYYDLAPAISYAAVCVSDLDRARDLYANALRMEEMSPDALHSVDHEALWGMADAQPRRAVFRGAGNVMVEVSQYDSASSRPLPDDYLLSDQGMMNIAVGYRQRASLIRAIDGVLDLGVGLNNPPPPLAGGTYLTTDDRISIELLLVPRELDADVGFVPRPRMRRPLVWESDLEADEV